MNQNHAYEICRQLWFCWLLVWLAWAFFAKRTRRRERPGTRLIYGSVVSFGAFILFSQPRSPFPGWLHARVIAPNPVAASIGILVTLAGLLFSVWARLHLGTNWSGAVTIKVGHELVRTGPYRFVRHPIYSGIVLATLGTAVCLGELRGFLGAAIVFLGFTYKSRLEEGFMTQTFGAAYDDYRRHTGGIIPKLL